MATIYFQGNAMNTCGELPLPGQTAPCFHLVTKDLKDITCADFKGKRVVLNIFPSLDTPVCAMSVRRFNKEAAALPEVAVINVSMDLPFAEGRFCAAEGIADCEVASAFRSPEFVKDYGVQIVDGPLKGLLARAVVVIDKDGKVEYSQLVSEVTNEPDYRAALDVLRRDN